MVRIVSVQSIPAVERIDSYGDHLIGGELTEEERQGKEAYEAYLVRIGKRKPTPPCQDCLEGSADCCGSLPASLEGVSDNRQTPTLGEIKVTTPINGIRSDAILADSDAPASRNGRKNGKSTAVRSGRDKKTSTKLTEGKRNILATGDRLV